MFKINNIKEILYEYNFEIVDSYNSSDAFCGYSIKEIDIELTAGIAYQSGVPEIILEILNKQKENPRLKKYVFNPIREDELAIVKGFYKAFRKEGIRKKRLKCRQLDLFSAIADYETNNERENI